MGLAVSNAKDAADAAARSVSAFIEVTFRKMATASGSDAVVDQLIVRRPPGRRNLKGVTADVHRRLTIDLRQPVRRFAPSAKVRAGLAAISARLRGRNRCRRAGRP